MLAIIVGRILLRNRSKILRGIGILLLILMILPMFTNHKVLYFQYDAKVNDSTEVQMEMQQNKIEKFEVFLDLANIRGKTKDQPTMTTSAFGFSNCITRPAKREIDFRGKYTILANFIMAENTVQCNEGVTYTTHSDFRYLDNLFPLVERWLAPISIAIYTPASDLQATLYRIAYVRECKTDLVKKWVTFHLFSERSHLGDPNQFLNTLQNSSGIAGVCDEVPPTFSDTFHSKRRLHNALYPINVARNIARREALTYYILASDIELYPSVNISKKFIELLDRERTILDNYPRPFVFVLPVFEMRREGFKFPSSKRLLAHYIRKGLARLFHVRVCPHCHRVPKLKAWVQNASMEADTPLNVFLVTKRPRGFHGWEPIYIGTNHDPFYDERFSWEGLRDKMSQVYALCLLDYDFMVLDNAFLIHRFAVRNKTSVGNLHLKKYKYQNSKAERRAVRELRAKYGNREECNRKFGQRNTTSSNWSNSTRNITTV